MRMTTNDFDQLVSINEATKLLGRNRATVTKWVATGAIPTVNEGGRAYIHRNVIERIRQARVEAGKAEIDFDKIS